MNTQTKRRYKQLRNDGIPVYSISRLNTYNTCPYAYYKTYVERDRGENNCYGIAGSRVHDWLEDIQNGDLTEDKLPKLLEVLLLEFQFDNIKFPSPAIGLNWETDMKHFANNFTKPDIDGITEKHIIYEVEDGIWLQGYIDLIGKKDGELIVLDWKTSSMFTGERLTEAGRQLLLYKDAIDKTTDCTVDRVCWYMIKYMEIEFDGRTRVVQRRNWAETIKSNIEKSLDREDSETVERLVRECIRKNSLKPLPQYARDKFHMKPHIKYYDAGEDEMQEARQYVVDTVDKIKNEESYEGRLLNAKQRVEDRLLIVKDNIKNLKRIIALNKNNMTKPGNISKKTNITEHEELTKTKNEEVRLNRSINNIRNKLFGLYQPCDVSGNWFFCQNLCNHRLSCEHLRKYNRRKR